jgi:hypothetical protein
MRLNLCPKYLTVNSLHPVVKKGVSPESLFAALGFNDFS